MSDSERPATARPAPAAVRTVQLAALPDIPLIQPGDDLGGVVGDALDRLGWGVQDGDVLVVAQKIVSKAEGRLVSLSDITPSARAVEIGREANKDARLVELILQEARTVARVRPGLVVTEHRLGFICANAGIDRSNVADGDAEVVALLPLDPDASAARLRAAILARFGADVGVIVNDSHGRPFRTGSVGVAIGVAGIVPLVDKRGSADLFGYTLHATQIGIGDEIAAAASLLMGQAAEGSPVVLVRGAPVVAGEARSASLLRDPARDMFR